MNWDNKCADKEFWITVGFTVFLFVLLILSGCHSANPKPEIPTTGNQALIRIVNQTTWPVALGMALCVIGVMTGINGSTKFMAWIGGGLALIGLSALVAALFAFIADHSLGIMIFLGGLILIGIVAFFHGAADLNGDGKINWQDVKQLFKWR